MRRKTVFTSIISYDDAVNQARNAGFNPTGSTSRMQGGQQLYIVFAEEGFKQRVSNMSSFAQNKIWG